MDFQLFILFPPESPSYAAIEKVMFVFFYAKTAWLLEKYA
jgi:hypothetical protein